MWNRTTTRAALRLTVVLTMLASSPALPADLELGEYLSSECTTCHQATGEESGIPGIAGWPSVFMLDVLEQYRNGERQNPVMQSVVQSMNEEELAAVAAWFEQVKVSK